MASDDAISLRDLIQAQLDALGRRFEDEKVHVAERSKLLADNFTQWREDNDRRLDGMNEKQAHLIHAESKFVLQSTYEAKHAELERRIQQMEQTSAGTTGRREQSNIWITAIIGIALVIAGIAGVWVAKH